MLACWPHGTALVWFVGNGLDRSVLPYQKHDVTRKPRAVRRDFMRCARPDVRMVTAPAGAFRSATAA